MRGTFVSLVAILVAVVAFGLAAVAFYKEAFLVVGAMALLVAIFGAVWRVGDILKERFKRSQQPY